MAREVWRQCVLVFADDRYSHAGNCILSPFEHWPFFLSTGSKYLFLIQRLLLPFDS